MVKSSLKRTFFFFFFQKLPETLPCKSLSLTLAKCRTLIHQNALQNFARCVMQTFAEVEIESDDNLAWKSTDTTVS